ncbi:MAG: thiosulfohydrolase SoxB [Gammaproteobacteria bacterium]|nr:MAG: thiosulfohydrolase SoxB [Gammaproteobacteria bacterium]
MNISRREFLQLLAAASAAGINLAGCEQGEETQKLPGSPKKMSQPGDIYEVPAFGNVSFLHMTDVHAQLMPVYFREPNVNLGIGNMKGNPPHLVGAELLKYFNVKPDTLWSHAYTYLNFSEAARKFGKVGGFAHLATLIKKLRAQRPGSLLLDGGDNWQGSATSLWLNGQDMVDAQKILGVDVMTGHWEFTFGADRVLEIIEKELTPAGIDFVAQNVVDNEFEEPVFKPYVIRDIKGVPCAIIGQAFPYTPIANPRYMMPDWSFGIRDERMQEMVDQARGEGAKVVIVVSHNGMDVDLKMATRVTGIDAIMGGHTHDGVPAPVKVSNAGGKTLVINSGSNGKFLSVLDLEVKNGRVTDFRYKLLPVFANMLKADPEMQAHIDSVRAPFLGKLNKELAITDELLYRRGNFNGTFDQIICDALIETQDAEIAFSPGFRWGCSVLPGQPITFENVMTQTSMTYPVVTRNELTGEFIKIILEDVADNIFNPDPYYQQGGDMVRVGGLKYTMDPLAKMSNRVSDMTLNGQPIVASKKYVVAGWASVAKPLEGTPVWDVVSDYLRDKKHIKNIEVNEPKLKNVAGNPGYAKL